MYCVILLLFRFYKVEGRTGAVARTRTIDFLQYTKSKNCITSVPHVCGITLPFFPYRLKKSGYKGGYILSSLYLFYLLLIKMPRHPSNDIYLYRVRIDGEFDYDKIVRFSNLVSDRYILVNHVLPHGNPHYHYYIETRYSQGNFSTKLKQEFGVKGGEYCVQKCDLDRTIEYCSYMFNVKNGNVATLISFCGFSALDIATYRENSKLIEKEFRTKMATGKKTQFDIVQLVLQRHDPKICFLPEVLYDEVISILKETRTMARPYHVRDIISSVMAFSNDKSAKQQIKDVTLKFFSSL